MSQLNQDSIKKALQTIKDPDSDMDIVTSGRVSSIVIRDNNIGFSLQSSPDKISDLEDLRQKCKTKILDLDSSFNVTVVLTADTKNAKAANMQNKSDILKIPGVKNVIAVASGKGGVGKSTVSSQLAFALKRKGYKVGIVDADIYGPSIPHILGVSGSPDINKENKMIPHVKDGISSISIGHLIDPQRATIWRAPMIVKAFYQLVYGTMWENIDYLIFDLPPGTGDIQISMSKKVPVSGVVLVSTPQEVALLDVKKAANMFDKVDIPIFGIVENMSYLEDESGTRHHVFGKGAVEAYANKEGYKFLGHIPIESDLREKSDSGKSAFIAENIQSCFDDIANIILG
ncbi:Mrp/NBP35 family ATP-binding protein [Rickettsiales bacterium]|nr:Mrp/NBP35 family ATP-binding protein [Rickettsiales bacterium]